MTKMSPFLAAALSLCALTIATPAITRAQTSPQPLLSGTTTTDAQRLKPSSDQVTVAASNVANAPGLIVTIQPGKDDYPGVNVKPAAAVWNLAAFGHVEVHVVNTGTKPLTLALRVDNAGDWHDNPWNTESTTLAPGETGVVKVIFGYAYGFKPGYALKPAAVSNLVLFTGKSDVVQSFRIDSIIAGGPAGEKPPVAPADVRLTPTDGNLLGRGMDASPTVLEGTSVSVRPTSGRWDLRQFTGVQVAVRNTGKGTVTPQAQIVSNGGVSRKIVAAKPLLPGETTTLLVPFANAIVPDLSQPATLAGMTSDTVSAVNVTAEPSSMGAMLRVESLSAVRPTPQMPEWLGKRPPVAGDWVKTLDDDFKGKTLDSKVWSVSGENYWDKTSHWSKDNVILENGVVKLRYEKKTGFNNDDTKQKPSNYASGYLHTYDKWAQRYGYFEARMKLPTAPGLWPAFWMMPDRGKSDDPQWKRQSTSDGGMEFDIMEHLTRWGAHRYNIAMHWDGYDKDHKSLGDEKIYVDADKDGYITAGLLWTPGSVIYYCNGREVLRWENPRISNVPEILMFTLPMGGWDNSPLDDFRLPADFVIDYVRVWQRKDLASGNDGKK